MNLFGEERCEPQKQGLSQRALAGFLDGVREKGLEVHALVMIRNGVCIADYGAAPYRTDQLHNIASAAKGILTTAVLFAVQEGRLSLQDKIARLFRDHLPEDMDPVMEEIRVYDLLNMATGHEKNIYNEMIEDEEDWIRGFFRIRPSDRPGHIYAYNNGAPHLAAQLVKQVTGQDVLEYLKKLWLDPLGIRLECGRTPQGWLDPPTMSMSARDFARYALFYLQEGAWEGRQLLAPELVRMVGKRNVPTIHSGKGGKEPPIEKTWGFGLYGTPNYFGGKRFSGGRTNQALYFPEENLAAVIMGNDNRTGEILEEFRKHIYLNLYQEPLKEGPEEREALMESEKRFSLSPEGKDSSVLDQVVSGRICRLEKNSYGAERISFLFSKDNEENFCMKTVRIRVESAGQVREFSCGLHGTWKENRTYLLSGPEVSSISGMKNFFPDHIVGNQLEPTKLSGAWTKENEFCVHQRSAARMSTVKFWFVFSYEGIKIRAHTYHLPVLPVGYEKTEVRGFWE